MPQNMCLPLLLVTLSLLHYHTSSILLPSTLLMHFRYVALVSGLGIGTENQNQFALQMFIDLITGQLGSVEV